MHCLWLCCMLRELACSVCGCVVCLESWYTLFVAVLYGERVVMYCLLLFFVFRRLASTVCGCVEW
jgi:hypothetical protein